MVKNRLSELQARAKHAPMTEAEENEMNPLNTKNGKSGKGGGSDTKSADTTKQQQPFGDIFGAFEIVIKNIDSVKVNVEDIHRLQGKILNSTHKNEALENEMEDKIAETKKLGNTIKTALKKEQMKIEEMSSDESKKLSHNEQIEMRMRKTKVNAHSKRFFTIWTTYNNQQVEFRDKSKKLLVRRCKIVNNDYTDEDIENMLDEGNTGVFATSILDQERLARQQLEELQDRHDEFIKLEKSIKEVHDMFMDIANLVNQQGEVIDSIYTHVMAAEIDVEKGKEHLGQAEKYQSSARRKKICLALFGIVILLIILLVILSELGVFSGGGDSSSSSSDNNSNKNNNDNNIETKIIYIYKEVTATSSTTISSTTVSSTTTMTSTPTSNYTPMSEKTNVTAIIDNSTAITTPVP